MLENGTLQIDDTNAGHTLGDVAIFKSFQLAFVWKDNFMNFNSSQPSAIHGFDHFQEWPHNRIKNRFNY